MRIVQVHAIALLITAVPSAAAYLKGTASQDEKLSRKIVRDARRLVEFGVDPALGETKKKVCDGDTFQPDVKKYYTIGTEAALVWSAGSDGGGQAFNRAVTLSSQITDASSHWRFVDRGNGRWMIRNRMTGMIIDRDSAYKRVETMQGGKTNSDFIVRGECFGAESLILSKHDGRNEAAFCQGNDCRAGATIELATAVVVDTKKTKCKYPKFLKSCDGYFKSSTAPIWRQSKYGKCGWRNNKRVRTCEQIEMRPSPTDPEQKWIIREIEDFSRPDTKAAPVVSALQPNVNKVTDDLIKVGLTLSLFVSNKIAPGASAAFGALLAVTGIQQQLNGDSGEALAQLAREVLDVVDDKIDQAIVKDNLEEAAGLLENARERFLIDYIVDKRARFDTNGQELNQAEFTVLSRELEQVGRDYVDAMVKLFAGPDDFSPTNINALRGQKAWSIIRLAMVEVLTLYQEAVALDAFTGATFDNLSYTCISIYEEHFNLDRLVSDLREKLVNTRDMLVAYRTDPKTLEFVTRDKKCQACTPDGCHKYTCGTERVAVKDTIRQIQFNWDTNLRDLWLQELRFDMRHLSYPIENELLYLDEYKSNTMALCEAMMNNSTLRDIYAPS